MQAEGTESHSAILTLHGGEAVAAQTGAAFYQVDVTYAAQLEVTMQQLFDAWGDIDVLVNNVGIGIFKPLAEVPVEEFDRVINTNLRSAFITARMLARHRHANGNTAYGRIINLCSTRYLQSEAGTEGYSASKGGIYSLTHALAVSLAPMHITINAIAPGWIHVREEMKCCVPKTTRFIRRVASADPKILPECVCSCANQRTILSTAKR